jgi:hypothetical protein
MKKVEQTKKTKFKTVFFYTQNMDINSKKYFNKDQVDLAQAQANFNDFPNEILIIVFSKLSFTQWIALETVCTRFNNIVQLLWQQLSILDLNGQTVYGRKKKEFHEQEPVDILEQLSNRIRPSQLKHLDLSTFCNTYRNYTDLNKKCCAILANCSANLRHLNLSHCIIDNELFMNATVNIPLITSVNLSYTKIKDLSIKQLFKNCKHLESIDLSENNFDGDGFDVDSRLERLQFLALNNCTIDELGHLVQFLKLNGKSLLSFHANASTLNSAEIFEELRPSIENVRSFSMAFDSLNNTACFHLLENLVELDLSVSITDDHVFATILNRCIKLTTLNLAHTYLTDAAFTSMSINAPLTDLDVFGADDLTRQSLERIGFYLGNTLQRLDISACASLSGEDIIEFLSSVKHICLLNLKIMDAVNAEFVSKLIKLDFPNPILVKCYDCDFLDLNDFIQEKEGFERELLDDGYSQKITYKKITFLSEAEKQTYN